MLTREKIFINARDLFDHHRKVAAAALGIILAIVFGVLVYVTFMQEMQHY
jgi:hypothetical protein